MDDRERNRDRRTLALLVAYALAAASWGLASTPLGPDEARDILIGRDVLARGVPECARGAGAPGAPTAEACAWPGAVLLAPVAAAWADRTAGLPGARLAGAAMGLVLVLLVHRIGGSARWGRRGLLVAGVFVLVGVPLQLFATVHPRELAALLVGLALALSEEPAPADPGPRGQRSVALAVAAGLSLALAAMASYVAALFAIPLAVAIALGRRDRRAAAAFAITAAAALALYGWFAVRPAWPELREALGPFRVGASSVTARDVSDVFDGIAMPLLLATFAVFHRDGGWRAAAAVAVACAAFLVPYASATVEDARTARLLAFVVLAPAAGVGVARMSDIFAHGNPSRRARPLFAGAVLVVIAAFGVHETRALRREGPDLSPAVAFLRGDGAGGRTVLVESDFGSPEYVYRYYLEAATPPARVVPIARAGAAERRAALAADRPDYVVLDDHHSAAFGDASREWIKAGFSVAATYRIPLGASEGSLQVLRREAR